MLVGRFFSLFEESCLVLVDMFLSLFEEAVASGQLADLYNYHSFYNYKVTYDSIWHEFFLQFQWCIVWLVEGISEKGKILMSNVYRVLLIVLSPSRKKGREIESKEWQFVVSTAHCVYARLRLVKETCQGGKFSASFGALYYSECERPKI